MVLHLPVKGLPKTRPDREEGEGEVLQEEFMKWIVSEDIQEESK